MATAFTDWEGTCLAHHGIKGQKWGVRRFQNPDGTLTELGKRREQKNTYKSLRSAAKESRNSKSLIERNKKLLSDDKMKELYNVSQKADKRLRQMTKGRGIEDPDYEDAYSNYYKARDQIVSDMLGKYENKKTLKRPSGESAGRAIRDAISYAQDELRKNGGKTKKEVDEEKSFSDFKKSLNSSKKIGDLLNDSDKFDRARDHIAKKQTKLINEWWNKKTSNWRSNQTMQSFDAEAMRYAKQAARNMGLPTNDKTLYFLLEWFFNGDD